MFAKEISCLTLTSEIASSLFQNVTGDHFRRDESFLATLRALFYNRVPKEESICLRYSHSNYTSSQIKSVSHKDCARAFLGDSRIISGDQGVLYIHSFEGGDENSDASMETLKDGIPQVVSGYTPLDDVSAWIKANGKFDVQIYSNAEKRNTIIFTGPLNLRRWHLLEALIPRYFPWYIETAPFDEEEIALLKTLTKGTAKEYEEKIREFTQKFDFRTTMIRSKLTGFETYCDRAQLSNIRRQIEDINISISRLNSQYSQFYRRFNDLNALETGLVEKINRSGGEESSELLDYFLLNKSLTLAKAENGLIEFIVATTMSNFDPDAADSMIRNRRGYFYHSYETGDAFSNKEMTDDRIERLLGEIFEKETMKLRICAAYRLNFSDGCFDGIEGYRFPDEIKSEYTPNQHIQRYHCLGDNATYIREAMNRRDFIGAVEACVASAKSVNVLEGATCGIMMEDIFSDNAGKIIELPDGSIKTPLEAVMWLEAQDAIGTEKEEQEEGHE